jgi:hypothetical protein
VKEKNIFVAIFIKLKQQYTSMLIALEEELIHAKEKAEKS